MGRWHLLKSRTELHASTLPGKVVRVLRNIPVSYHRLLALLRVAMLSTGDHKVAPDGIKAAPKGPGLSITGDSFLKSEFITCN